MKNNHKTLNEEILRIKSLFTEERLYGNLVEAGEGGMAPNDEEEVKKYDKNIGADNADLNYSGDNEETPKKTEPIIVTDFDKSWDYKAENGKWYTKKKSGGEWIMLSDNPKMKSAVDKLNAKHPKHLEDSKVSNTDNTKKDDTKKDDTNTDNTKKDDTNKDIINKDGKKTTTDDKDDTKKDAGEFNWDGVWSINPISKDEKGKIRKQNKIDRKDIRNEDKRRLQLCDDVVKTLSSAFLPTLRNRRISKEEWVNTMGVDAKEQQDLFEACLKIKKVVKKHSTGSFINGKNKLESIAGILSGDIDEETHLKSKYKIFGSNDEEETTNDTNTDVNTNTDNDTSKDSKKTTTDNDGDKRETWSIHNNNIDWGTLTKKGNRYALQPDSNTRLAVKGSNKLGDGYMNLLKNPRNDLPKGLYEKIVKANKSRKVQLKKGGRIAIFTVD